MINVYGFEMKEAFEIQEFLLALMQINPKQRVSARDALNLKWMQF